MTRTADPFLRASCKETRAYCALMADRAVQAREQGDLRLALNCAMDLAHILRGVLPAAPALLVTLARKTARQVIETSEDDEALDMAQEILREDGHIALGVAAQLAAALPAGTCDALVVGLSRAGYLSPDAADQAMCA